MEIDVQERRLALCRADDVSLPDLLEQAPGHFRQPIVAAGGETATRRDTTVLPTVDEGSPWIPCPIFAARRAGPTRPAGHSSPTTSWCSPVLHRARTCEFATSQRRSESPSG